MSDPWAQADVSDPKDLNTKNNEKEELEDQDEEEETWENKKYDSTTARGDRRPRGRGGRRGERGSRGDRGGHSHHHGDNREEHKDDPTFRGHGERGSGGDRRGDSHHHGEIREEHKDDKPWRGRGDRGHSEHARRGFRRGDRGRFPRSRPDGGHGGTRHTAERAKIRKHRMFENRHDKQVIFREEEQQIDPEKISTHSHFRSDREWDELNIPSAILEALEEIGFIYPSKIQSFGIDVILQEGFENLIAQAPNGSGKTATFVIGSLSRVDVSNPKVQVVCIGHTIELANQLFSEYEKITRRIGVNLTLLGRDSKPADLGQVVVTLPGTFSKMLKMKADFSTLKVFVVDEADHLLDSRNSPEFYNSLNHAVINSSIPSNVQFLLFSATFSDEIKTDIVKLLREMNEITIKKEELMLDLIKHFYLRCEQSEKISTFETILKRATKGIAVSFVNTCNFAMNVYRKMQSSGHKAALLMGRDMTVNERNLTMKDFRDGKYSVLITTNLLARGIDNTKVNCVVNFDLPRIIRSREMDYVLYLHRSGRCSRFGRKGICINLITNDKELQDLMSIQEYYSISITELKDLDEFENAFEDIHEPASA